MSHSETIEQGVMSDGSEQPCASILEGRVSVESSTKEKRALTPIVKSPNAEIIHDVDLIIWSIRLESVKRFHGQRFWEKETVAADHASLIDKAPQLESVAEHSWHVADIVLLLGRRFSDLDLFRCVRMAILHDKMEIVTGDRSPIGRDKSGIKSHPFNADKKLKKEHAERAAIGWYTHRLPEPLRSEQRADLTEISSGRSAEARFVRAVDKLQALSYVLLKKQGQFHDEHLRFTLKYSEKIVEYFPQLELHYLELKQRLLRQVARRREITLKVLLAELDDPQLELALWIPK